MQPHSLLNNYDFNRLSALIKFTGKTGDIFYRLFIRVLFGSIQPCLDISLIMGCPLDKFVDNIHQTVDIHLPNPIFLGSGIIQEADFEKIHSFIVKHSDPTSVLKTAHMKP